MPSTVTERPAIHQKEVLLVPLIISLLQIHRTIPRFWSAYNKSPCKQQGLFVKA